MCAVNFIPRVRYQFPPLVPLSQLAFVTLLGRVTNPLLPPSLDTRIAPSPRRLQVLLDRRDRTKGDTLGEEEKGTVVVALKQFIHQKEHLNNPVKASIFSTLFV